MNFRNTLGLLSFGIVLSSNLIQAPAFSSVLLLDSTASSDIRLSQSINCPQLEQFGRIFQSQLLTEINRRVAGETHRINRRKSLRINRIQDISFSGCRVTVRANVTLKRKIRRDAHGTVTMRGNVTSFNPAAQRVCYSNVQVTNVNLSRTLRIGERFYRWVANKVLPNGGCL
jgi:hypothetical protein